MTEMARFERRTITGDGVEIVWFDHGQPDGRPLMIVHGMGAGADQFDADARFSRARVSGHRARSAWPWPFRAGARASYTIERMARDLLEIMADAGCEAVDYVGNSLGGILALFLLKDHARRFRTLTTFGTAPALTLPALTPSLLPLTYRLMGRRAVGWIAARSTTPTAEGRAIIGPLVRDFDPNVALAVGRAVHRYDLTANALGFEGPYLIIRGARDSAVNRALDPKLKVLEQRPNVTWSAWRALAIAPISTGPDAFRKAVLDFIEK